MKRAVNLCKMFTTENWPFIIEGNIRVTLWLVIHK